MKALLEVTPSDELKFTRSASGVFTASMTLKNTSSNSICFKVKTTAPQQQYSVRPRQSYLKQGESQRIVLILSGEIPSAADPHKFIVQSCVAPAEDIQDFKSIWKNVDPSQICYNKLRTIFVEENNASSGEDNKKITTKSISSSQQTSKYIPLDLKEVDIPDGNLDSLDVEDRKALLEVTPNDELKFTFSSTTGLFNAYITLENTSSNPIFYKLNTMATLSKHFVSANMGFLKKGEIQQIEVTLCEEIPSAADPHRFMVQTCVVPVEDVEDLESIWKVVEPARICLSELTTSIGNRIPSSGEESKPIVEETIKDVSSSQLKYIPEELADARRELNEARKEIEESRATHSKEVKNIRKKLAKALDDRAAALRELNEACTENEEIRTTHSIDVSKIRQELVEARADADAARQELNEARKEIEGGLKEILQVRELDDAQRELNEARKEIEESRATHSKEVKNIRKKLAKARADGDAARQELNDAHKAIEENRVAHLNDVKEIREELDDAQRELNEARKEIEESRATHSKEVKNIRKKLAKARADGDAARQELNDARKAIEENRVAHLNDVKEIREELAEAHRELNEARKELEESRASHSNEVTNIRQELETVRSDGDAARRELNEARKENEESRATNSKNVREIRQAKAALDAIRDITLNYEGGQGMRAAQTRFECEICALEFTDVGGNCTPKVLRCGHTICSSCVNSLQQNNSVTCPFCRVVTSKLAEICNNYIILGDNH
ncbi:hypothetical protein CRE_05838 [Caenorhabditis remanei]|uniref:Major sperm protein n=1 Tax=Caenorhabditis remanei TaxID=31234 RepID=E3MNL9_CAERE|nr:hypothetical protein CRE_05838 [Caenorhabditis remanei]